MQEIFKLNFAWICNLLFLIFETMTKRYKSKYGFSEMEIGDERRIRVNRVGRDRVVYNLRSACSAETKRFGTTWIVWANESGVYYKRTNPSVKTELKEILNEEIQRA